MDTDDPVAMAGFYGVSLEKYQHGQEWARKNLPQLRSIARRDAGKLETKQIMVTGNTESPERPILVLGIVVFAITVACRFLQGRCREVTAA